MPSIDHEVMLQLFRNRPELAVTLLRSLTVAIPDHVSVEVGSAEFNQVVPTEYQADTVVLVRATTSPSTPLLAIAVEVQLRVDPRKRFTWPLYQAALRARHECEACLLVLTGSDRVATWASQTIELGPGNRMQPYVMGPRHLPRINSVEEARRAPELAVLSAMAHGEHCSLATAAATLAAVAELTEDEAKLYSDCVLAALGPAARRAMEEMMALENYQPRSELVREWLAEGKAKGLAEGKAEGLAEGKAEGKAEALLTIVWARGLACSEEQAERIRTCRDSSLLSGWLSRVVEVHSVDELLGRR